MNRSARILAQGATWLGLAAVIGAFAQGPAFSPVADDHAELRLSLAHLSERLVPCRQLTEEERQELPPTRRVQEVCERGRSPTVIELRINGQLLLERTITPAGWHDDGRAYLLQRFDLPAGRHRLDMALRDTPREEGFDMQRQFSLHLAAGEAALLEVGDGDITLSRSGDVIDKEESS